MPLAVALIGCGVDGQTTGPGMPQTRSLLETCVAGGGQVSELWSTSNLHGEVSSLAVSGTTVVLGSKDGSVKQWSTAGTAADPTYGTPFTEEGAPVGALAIDGGGQLVAVDASGQLHEWQLSTAKATRSMTVDEASLTAVALSPDGRLSAVGAGTTPSIWVVDRKTGTVSPALTTTLASVSSLAFGGDALFTAGRFYGTPMIERRGNVAPYTVTSSWGSSLDDGVTAIAG
jgi:WD40 repeat protein